MNARQLKFAQEYLKNPEAKESAIKAGYSKKTAKEKGCFLLKNKEIQEYLKKHRAIAEEKTGLTVEWVLNRFKEISDRCMQAEPVMIYDGQSWVESGEYRFDSSGANKATEMIGKHVGAFEKDNEQKKNTTIVNLPDDV